MPTAIGHNLRALSAARDLFAFWSDAIAPPARNVAAAAFHAGHRDVDQIETAYHTLAPLLGAGAAGVFLVALLASGISSSAAGTNATESPVLSQVLLSLVLPVPMIALLMLSRRPTLMGAFVAGRGTMLAAGVATAVVLALNAILLLQLIGVSLPGLPAAS